MKGLSFVAAAVAAIGLVQGRPQVVTSSPAESSTSVASVEPSVPTATTTRTGPGPITTPTNPYSANCPVASNFIINDFQYANGPPPMDTRGTSFEVKYGELELKCPIRPGAYNLRFGLLSMHCDDANMVSAVVPVGGSTIYFLVNQWCPAVPQPAEGISTLNLISETYDLSPFLTCDHPNPQTMAIRNCSQSIPDFVIPARNFFTSGSKFDFTPIATNGTKVESCPIVAGVNPILQDPDNCLHYGHDDE